MKGLKSLVLGAMMASVVLGPVFLLVPNTASAVEYAGTSPLFAVDSEWSLYVGFFAAGDIIEWYWSSGDSLIFSLLCTVGSTTTHLSGFTYDDGYVVETTGHYGLCWYNNNLFFSASVDYWVAGFTPFTTVTAPLEGSYEDSTTVSVQGTTDAYANDVRAGPDALHLTEAVWSGNDWGVDDYSLTEGQNSILVRTYYWLDYYGYYKQVYYDMTIQVTCDTTPPDLAMTSPSSSGACLMEEVYVSWQCSDENGVAKKEVKIDALGWNEVTADSYTTELADGHHVVSVKVTDLAGNQASGQVTFICDTAAPDVDIGSPVTNAKIDKDAVDLWWYGGDALSGLDHYEIRIAGGDWINVGEETSYSFVGLEDGWYSVDVKSVDRSGNVATATTGFGVYTSIWSQNGPYQGIPLYGLIAAIIIVAVVATFLLRRKKGGPAVASVPKEEPPAPTS